MAAGDTLFVPTYARTNPPFVEGKGVYLYDSRGREYLDFGSGIAVNALGHGHPRLVKTLREQGARLLHASNLYYTRPQVDLARLLVKRSFGDRVFLCNSGTEAVEAAIKFSRKWAAGVSETRYHILSFEDGFHGRTYGALSATAQKKFHAGFGPMMEGFHHAPFNDIDAARKVLDKHEFAAVLVEPLQGESGIRSADTKFLRFLRRYTRKHRIALVFDEIQCGGGRTGTLWNYEQHKVVPDVMTLAKPIGGGLPLGAVVCTEKISRAISPGDHGTTFGGNPLACALGCEVLREVGRKPFLKDVARKGAYLVSRLEALAANYPAIKDVRGAGLMVGVEMSSDPNSIIEACRKKGLLVIKAGHNTVRFMPPLIVRNAEIDRALEVFEAVLKSRRGA